MIEYESFWKKEILEYSKYFLSAYNKKVSKRLLFNVEKKLLLSFLHIRQNNDHYFRGNQNYPKSIKLTAYPILDKKVAENDIGNRYKLFEGNTEEILIKDLCHNFVHISINSKFVPSNEGILGVFFASDHNKNIKLYYIQLCKVSQILESIYLNKEISIEPIYNQDRNIFSFVHGNKW